MQDKNQCSAQDQLLKKVLDECMEEQLSFVPPEREIARMHKFSPEFLERMRELLQTKGREANKKYRKLEKREFIYGFNKIAACILVVLVVGGLSLAGITLFSPKGSTESADMESQMESCGTEETTEAPAEAVTEEEMKAESVEEEAAEEAPAEEEPEAAAGSEKDGAHKIPDAKFLDGVLKPAAEQELPEEFGKVKAVLNSPVILTDAEEILVTVGNMEEHPIYYYQYMDLEVLIDGYWYLVEPLQEPAEEDRYQMVYLESGMAQDESIPLANYELDYDAEMYRVVTYVDGMTICSPFRFAEELFGEEESE